MVVKGSLTKSEVYQNKEREYLYFCAFGHQGQVGGILLQVGWYTHCIRWIKLDHRTQNRVEKPAVYPSHYNNINEG